MEASAYMGQPEAPFAPSEPVIAQPETQKVISAGWTQAANGRLPIIELLPGGVSSKGVQAFEPSPAHWAQTATGHH